MTTELDWVPASACTLPTTEQPVRVAEFDSLFADQFTAAQRLDDTHARLTLTGSPGVARQAQDLADRETGCCSFFGFAISGERDGVRIDITVPAAQAAVLEALVARAEAVRSGAAS
jgi:hypothetical protein